MRLNTSGSDENSSSRNGAIKDCRVSKEYIRRHNDSMSTSIIEEGDTDYEHVRNTQTWHPVITDQDFGSSTG